MIRREKKVVQKEDQNTHRAIAYHPKNLVNLFTG